jgi:hypothetical protein
MKIKIGEGDWQKVILFEPPSRTVILEDGSVWHLAKDRNEILELDILALAKEKRTFPKYALEIEEDDELTYEMFYFYKFNYDQADYLKFPVYLLEGKCVQVESTALRYFLADTLFFDFLISNASSDESITEVWENMTKMKRKWNEMRMKQTV